MAWFMGILKNFFGKIELIFTVALCLALIYGIFLITFKPPEIILMGFYLFFCCTSILVTFFIRKSLLNSGMIVRILFIVSIAWLIRITVSHYLDLTQKGDYGSYLSVAGKLSAGTFTHKLYYGIFPHALNYPIFLSLIYKLIGNQTWLVAFINIICGLVETGCAVAIAEKSAGKKFGLIAGLAIALNPSSIIFTNFAGGEPVYSAVIMAALLCFVNVGRNNPKKAIVFTALTGVICGVGNFFRPTGIIFLIACGIMLLLFEKFPLKMRLIRTAVLIVSYMAIIFITGRLTYHYSGYEKPSHGYGWNLYVGANEESKGFWSAQDSEEFLRVELKKRDASAILAHFAKEGVKRYYEMKSRIVLHFVNKLSIWFDESFVAKSVTSWQNNRTIFKSADIAQSYTLLCFSYNLFVIAGAIAAMICLGISKNPPPGLKAASTYMLGCVLVFMVLEAGRRYKGAYYSILTLLGAYGICFVVGKIRKTS